MTEFVRTAMSLAAQNYEEIERRDYHNNLSLVIDRDLGRYYDMLQSHREEMRELLSEEWSELELLVRSCTQSLRHVSVNFLRVLITDWQKRGNISKATENKINKLDDAKFLSLFDALESPRMSNQKLQAMRREREEKRSNARAARGGV